MAIPVSRRYFENIPFTSANKRVLQQLKERLTYSRDLYLTEDSDDYFTKINLKKEKIVGNFIGRTIRKMMTVTGVILRKIFAVK